MKPILKRFFILLFILIVVVVVWFVKSRVDAPGRALLNQTLSTPAPTRVENEIRIGTYNIAHGRGGKYGASNWTGKSKEELEAHLREIADQIKKAKLDIVVLNEVDFDSTWSRNINQAELIAREAKFPYLATQRNMDAAIPFFRMAFGNAVMSRFPIKDLRLIDFPSLSKTEALLGGDHDGLLCVIQTPLGEVRVLAVHLEYRSEALRVAAGRIILEISHQVDTPMIVAGDFNSTRKGLNRNQVTSDDENTMDLLLHGGWFQTRAPGAPSVEDFTFPSEQPDRMIDWILCTPQLAQTVDWKAHPSLLSDHRMVSVPVIPAPPHLPILESTKRSFEMLFPKSQEEAIVQANNFLDQLSYDFRNIQPIGVLETADFYIVCCPMLASKKDFKPDIVSEFRIPKKEGPELGLVIEGMTKAQLNQRLNSSNNALPKK